MDIYGKKELNTIIGCKCDTCGKSTEKGEYIPIRIEFSYGSELDGETYDFCTNKCIINFLIKEEAKNNPRIDIEFGKEK